MLILKNSLWVYFTDFQMITSNHLISFCPKHVSVFCCVLRIKICFDLQQNLKVNESTKCFSGPFWWPLFL